MKLEIAEYLYKKFHECTPGCYRGPALDAHLHISALDASTDEVSEAGQIAFRRVVDEAEGRGYQFALRASDEMKNFLGKYAEMRRK